MTFWEFHLEFDLANLFMEQILVELNFGTSQAIVEVKPLSTLLVLPNGLDLVVPREKVQIVLFEFHFFLLFSKFSFGSHFQLNADAYDANVLIKC